LEAGLELEKYYIVDVAKTKTDRTVVTTKQEGEIIGCQLFAMIIGIV